MSESQVIARRFRPQAFDQVVGQEAITRTLTNAITTGRIHHAYLFTGARGVGKTTTARILAKALNCHLGITTEPCGVCPSCQDIAASRSIDVLEIDAASNTGVDNVREVIINTVSIAPARDRYKIFIIDEVHMLSTAAFNALLKTLEEPPPHVVFILATTELQKVPETILSRCQVFEFRTITLKKIFSQLKTITDNLGVKISDTALFAIARAGEGSMRDAESALDQVISFSGQTVADEDVSAALGLVDTETLNATVRAVGEQDSARVLRIVDEVVSRGYDLRNFCRELMVHFRALLVTKIAGFDPELVQMAEGEGESLARMADAFSEQDLVRFFSILTKTEQDIRVSPQPRFQLEIGLMKLVHSRRLYLLEEAISKLAEINSRLNAGAAPPAPVPPSARPAQSRPPQRPLKPRGEPQRLADIAAPTHAPARTGRTEPPPSAAEPPAQAAAPAPPVNAPPVNVARAEDKSPAQAHSTAPPLPPEPPPHLDEPYEVELQLPADPARPASAESVQGAKERIKDGIDARGRMMLGAAFGVAESVEVDGDFIRVSFSPKNAMFKSKIEGKAERKLIEEVGRQLYGRQLTLAVSVGAETKAESSAKPKETATDKEQPDTHPAVRALVDKFRGEILEVVKPDS